METSMGPATTGQLLHFEVHPDENLPSVIRSSIMSYVISATQLSSITTFAIELHQNPQCDLLRNELIPFFSACASIRIVHVTKNATELLHEVTQKQLNFFPSLEVLSVKADEPWKVLTRLEKLLGVKTNEPRTLTRLEQVDFFDYLLALLEVRQELNLPVKVLDLTGCDTGKSAIIEFWDKSMEVNVRRRQDLCVATNGSEDTQEKCHSCGIV